MSGESFESVSVGWKLFATAFFVLINGFFVAAEFALVKVRRTRIEARAERGERGARLVAEILGKMDHYLSACQLGITLASLVLGWLAEPAVATLIISFAEMLGLTVANTPGLHLVALAMALTVITVLHMTVGEQAPKVWALQNPEKLAILTAYPLWGFATVLRPLIAMINAVSNWLARLGGTSAHGFHEGAHDIGELRAALRASSLAGQISSRQQTFGENILSLINMQVRHIMLPRVDVVYLSTARDTEENVQIMRESGHSRLPWCDPDLDHVVGMIHGKDVLAKLTLNEELDFPGMIRTLPSVPDTLPLSRLILDLQKQQRHCATVVDEHGTTVGLCFLEDSLEEIVGPLHDEFDQSSQRVERPSEDVIEMAGNVPLPEAAEILGDDLGNEDDTIGGYITFKLGRIPSEGDVVEMSLYTAKVVTMSKRRITRLRFETIAAEQADSSAE